MREANASVNEICTLRNKLSCRRDMDDFVIPTTGEFLSSQKRQNFSEQLSEDDFIHSVHGVMSSPVLMRIDALTVYATNT